jgi:TIR domain
MGDDDDRRELEVIFSGIDEAWGRWLAWWFRDRGWRVSTTRRGGSPGMIEVRDEGPTIGPSLYVALTREAVEVGRARLEKLRLQEQVRRARLETSYAKRGRPPPRRSGHPGRKGVNLVGASRADADRKLRQAISGFFTRERLGFLDELRRFTPEPVFPGASPQQRPTPATSPADRGRSHAATAAADETASTTSPSPARARRRAATGAPRSRNLVFVSYSHRDEKMMERLRVHLKPLVRDGKIELWVAGTELRAGDPWREEIQRAVSTCGVAILLVSGDFLASDFIHRDELRPLLDAARRRQVTIIPVFVTDVNYEDTELGSLQGFNKPSKPLSRLSRPEREAVFAGLAGEVERILGRGRSG